MSPQRFQTIIWDYYRANRRDFPWRNTQAPYRITVSEIMLQQTQAQRVIPKYLEFIKHFPTWKALRNAPLRDILTIWQGLGYNRRAKSLHALARIITDDYHGKLPSDPEILKTLPGIGKATAASICAFAFNKPTIFIETNIRSVYIDAFFPGHSNIDDKELLPLIKKTLDRNNPREWYFALMDYGVKLKREGNNPSRQSKHHTRQSSFIGSHRQIRGLILKTLIASHTSLSATVLSKQIDKPLEKVTKALRELTNEGYLTHSKKCYQIT